MHLLALGAFWLSSVGLMTTELSAGRLNAPFGARCFLAAGTRLDEAGLNRGLNAPFGARCFLAYLGLRMGAEKL